MSLAGEPVEGITLQEGGLELQLTLLNATTMQLLSDDHNPRPQEGLLAETKENKKVRLEMPLTVRLTGSHHTFKCFVMLMSSDISGDLIKVKVSRPNLAAANETDPLCVITRAFKSRARSNINEPCYKRTLSVKRSSARTASPNAPNIDKDRVVRRKSADTKQLQDILNELSEHELNELVDGLDLELPSFF